jgi:histidinol-phosphate phosphatase family protein
VSARCAVFLDKDGTLLENLPYNATVERIRPAPGAEEALHLLGRTGLALFVVSNQPGVALGRFPAEQLQGVGTWLEGWFRSCGAQLAGFLWCPHAPDPSGRPQCACRKPRPGMLLRLARRHRLRLADSWMVGDILDDVEAGRHAGCVTVLIDNGNETEWVSGVARQPHFRVPDLAAAARLVAGRLRADGIAS